MNNLKTEIQSSLINFSSGALLNNSKSLLSILGYDSDRTIHLSPNNYKGFSEYFQIEQTSFVSEKAKVKEWQSIDIIFHLTEDDIKRSHSLLRQNSITIRS